MNPANTENWTAQALERLAASTPGGYDRAGPPATEPTALAALALKLWENVPAAERAEHWLLGRQAEDGSFGVDAAHPGIGWPTGWVALTLLRSPGVLATSGHAAADTRGVALQGPGQATTAAAPADRRRAGEKAVRWLLQGVERSVEPSEETRRHVGHDTTLRGWPWVESTSPWVEPTAISMLALRRAGAMYEARFREAVQLLLDRQLATGGWNYGNTIVLGNSLRPHLQATGLALWALAGEPGLGPRLQRSLDYLASSLHGQTPPVSLSYGIIGLAAHGTLPATADDWLQAAAARTLAGAASPYKLALLLLAAKHEELT